MKVSLRCFGQTLNVYTTSPKFFVYITSIDRLFSLPVIITENNGDGPNLNIIEGFPPKLTFEPQTRSFTFRVEWPLVEHSDAIASLLAQLLCLACIDANTFILHAAAISQENAAYLLIGGMGAGKTSLSVALCRDSRFSWLSNDHVGLSRKNGEIILCEGHDFIDFRKSSFSLIRKLLSSDIVKKIEARFPLDSTPWTKTTPPFSVSELALSQDSLPRPVKALFFPLVDLAAYECFQEMPDGKATTVLLQMLTWPLQGVETFILDNSGKAICPSIAIEPTRGWIETYDFVNSLISQCPAYIVCGKLESAIEFINQKISQLT